MSSLRRFIQACLAAGLLLAGLAQPGVGRAASRPALPADFEQVAENDLFQLWANPETLAFQVVDKRSDYTWQSSLAEKGEDDRLNTSWTAFAQSGISIEYLDAKAVGKRTSITNSETTIDYQATADGFEAGVTFVDYEISLRVRVTLEPAGVRVEVPFASITEGDTYRLGLVYVYPFLGATRHDDVPGYMFFPDGSGSIIRFAATTKARNMFYGRYYGDDLGMIGEMPWDPTSNSAYALSIPVSGMVHGEGENAYIAIVEKGAAYGELQVHPAGVTTNFNFMANAFIYTESYFQATNRSGAGVTTMQARPNEYDIVIHYRFLTGAESTYVGMARSYQAYLLEQGRLQTAISPGSDIGIRLEFLGGDKERVLFWNRFIPMTTVSQMAALLAELDVRNPEVIYYGWQPLGALAMPPRSLKLERDLGSLAELKALVDSVAAEGGHFSLYLDPQAAIWGERGYSPRNDLALAINNSNLLGFNRQRANYFLTLRALGEHFGDLADDVYSDLGAGLAIDGLGRVLYSDFRRNSPLSREAAIGAYQALLAEHPGRAGFYMPNDYVFGAMQAYYDLPLSDSGYLYASEAVPFLPVVLAGYVPYYGPGLNFSSSLQADLLRHADFGVYPSFFLTQEPTARILETPSNWIYTSAYAQWGGEVERTYQWLNTLLAPVKGQAIVAREALAPGVMATTYANSQQIVVNYNDQPFLAEGLEVPALDAIRREVTP